MNQQQLGTTDLSVSVIGYGCMGLGGGWNRDPLTEDDRKAARAAVDTALAAGINFYDHADIYTLTKAETVFGEMLAANPSLREQMVIQSKCGIRFGGDPTPDAPTRYDFSYEHIIWSAEQILKRLQIETLDVLLLHRPDPLVEPEEVARAFGELHAGGKVRHFGVSNHTPAQMDLLQSYVDQPLVANQIEISITHNHVFNAGVAYNQNEPGVPLRGEGVIEYCRLNEITIQSWSPLAQGYLSGRITDDSVQQATAAVVAEIADAHSVSREAIVLAWLLRHPAQIQPIIGTTNPDRIRACAQAADITLSREEWYRLFAAGRGAGMP